MKATQEISQRQHAALVEVIQFLDANGHSDTEANVFKYPPETGFISALKLTTMNKPKTPMSAPLNKRPCRLRKKTLIK